MFLAQVLVFLGSSRVFRISLRFSGWFSHSDQTPRHFSIATCFSQTHLGTDSDTPISDLFFPAITPITSNTP